MKNLRPFQIVLIGVFAALALAGVVFLSLFNTDFINTNKYGGSVEVWGTFDRQAFREVFDSIKSKDKEFEVVRYIQKDSRTFDRELTNAIAEGRSPDLVALPHDSLVAHRAKLFPISFETFSKRTFRDLYVDGAEIFMLRDAIYGIPFGVDPLVMYWNRDMFSGAGLAAPPKTWEELVNVTVPRVTRTNTSLNIFQSAVAFGEYRNIRHAKDVLSMLLLQSGSSIVVEEGTRYEITLDKGAGGGLPPANATLSFYTQFALPSHQSYSWNRSLEEDHLQFLAGELGLYFGPGSEYYDIERENPNLNFDLTTVPQGAGASILRDYGTFYAFAIPKGSDNRQGAYLAAQMLGSESSSAELARLTDIAPVHRGEIAKGTGDPYRQVLYDSALIAHGWLDPDSDSSDTIFRQMVEDVTSGRLPITDAVRDATGRLRLLF